MRCTVSAAAALLVTILSEEIGADKRRMQYIAGAIR